MDWLLRMLHSIKLFFKFNASTEFKTRIDTKPWLDMQDIMDEIFEDKEKYTFGVKITNHVNSSSSNFIVRYVTVLNLCDEFNVCEEIDTSPESTSKICGLLELKLGKSISKESKDKIAKAISVYYSDMIELKECKIKFNVKNV